MEKNLDDLIKPLNIKPSISSKEELKHLENKDLIKPLNIKPSISSKEELNHLENKDLIKPLNIKPSISSKEELSHLENKDLIKPLSIDSSIKIATNNEKKFDLSYEYMRSKVSTINNMLYGEIKKILVMINREDCSEHDNEILKYGKEMQEKITDLIVNISNNDWTETILKINSSHSNIIELIKSIDDKNKTLMHKFQVYTGRIIEKNKEEIISAIKLELTKNKEYLNNIILLEETIKNKRKDFVKEQNNLNIYIDIAQVLSTEFEKENFITNKDLINRRILSLKTTKTMMLQTFGIMEMQENKLLNYNENINNIINILIPNFLNTLTLIDYKNDDNYNQLKNTIIEQLSKNI